MKRKVLWNSSMGVATMNSAVNPFCLSEREFKAIQDWRPGDRSLKVRYPNTVVTTTGLSGHVRGAGLFNINGVEVKVIAVESGGVTNVYQSTGTAFSAITASTGKYGDTTLTTPGTAVPASCNTATNVMTFSNEMNWQTGQAVGTSITNAPFTKGETYYANRNSSTTYTFHSSYAAAVAGTGALDLVTSSSQYTTGSNATKFYPHLGNAVSFEVVREVASGDTGGGAFYNTTGRDLLVISDGSKVLVYDRAVTGTGNNDNTAKHIAAWHPGTGKVRQEAGWDKYLSMSTATVVPTDSDGGGVNVLCVDNSAHPDTSGTTPAFTFTTGCATNDWAKFDFTGGGGAGSAIVGGKQLHILYDCPSDRYIWDKIKVQVSNDDVTYYNVYVPGTDNKPVITDADRGFTLASFFLEAANVPAATVVKYVKFTYTFATAPTANMVVYVLGIMGGGSIPGGTLFRTSYYNSGSRAESIGVTCDDRLGRNTSFMGCQDSRNYIEVPASTAIYYSYFVTGQTSTTANRDTGLDYFLLYARAPGSKNFLYTGSQVLNAYSGSWAFSNVNGSAQTASGDFTTVVTSLTYYSRKAPDGQNMPVPPSKCLAAIGGRLFCGESLSSNVATTDSPGDVYYSEQDMPFRFRDVIAYNDVGVPDPTSAGRVVIPGEKVRQLRPLIGENIGTGAMAVFTDKSMGKLEGPDSLQLSRFQRIMPYGTESPWSVRTYQGIAVWLDHTGQVRFYGRNESPSKNRVDDRTRAVPLHRKSYASGIVYNDCYYLAYTMSTGAINNRCLVYDFKNDSWCEDTAPTSGIQYGVFYNQGKDLYCVDDTCYLFYCENPNATSDTLTDGTDSPIVPTLSLREIHSNGESQVSYGRIGVLTGSNANKKVFCYWTAKSGTKSYKQQILIRGANYTSGTKTVTLTNGFQGYSSTTSDTFVVTAGTGLTPATYAIVSNTDDTLVLATSPGSTVSDATVEGYIGDAYAEISLGETGVVWAFCNSGTGLDAVTAYPTIVARSTGISSGVEFFSVFAEVSENVGDNAK